MIQMNPVLLSSCKEVIAAACSERIKKVLKRVMRTPSPGMLKHWKNLPWFSSTMYNGMETGVCITVLQKRDPTLAVRAGKASCAARLNKQREIYEKYIEVEVIPQRVNDYCGVITKKEFDLL